MNDYIERVADDAMRHARAALATFDHESAIRSLEAAFGDYRPSATKRFTVTVERDRQPAPAPPSDDPAGLRVFISQQMIEAKDEAAQAACCRYILRNRLLG